MLSRTLKMAFWVCYDHLGKLLAANLLCMLALLFPLGLAWAAVAAGDPAMMLLLGVPMLVLVFGVVLPVEAAAIAHMAKELIDTRDGSLRTFFRGLRLYAGRAIGLGLAYVAAAAVAFPLLNRFGVWKPRELDRGTNMQDKVCIVTGCNTGIGTYFPATISTACEKNSTSDSRRR